MERCITRLRISKTNKNNFLTERNKRKSKDSKKKQNELRKKTKENSRDAQVVFPMETFFN